MANRKTGKNKTSVQDIRTRALAMRRNEFLDEKVMAAMTENTKGFGICHAPATRETMEHLN